ncbi:unnamed protein product [Rotaria sordida]|uniref:ATP-dependent DNA helicase n=1 Tax=Rotaria sordida TaxID=392033 RepID=A0A813XTM0_9BILA|nr:unnamed protein product [Rotaria sordida]
MQMMRKLVPTGVAAAEIDGMTIHSFLGEQRNSGKPWAIKPGDSKLEKEWRSVEYLLIDEMSIVGLTLLAKFNRIVSTAKHVDPQVPFGVVNIIFFGDYLQYRSVYDAPLHTDFSLPSKKKSSKLLTEKEIQQRVARSLILLINCVAYSVSTDVLSEIFPKNTQYIHRPLYALTGIAKSKIESNLEELQPKLVPIPVIEQTFRVDVSDVLP